MTYKEAITVLSMVNCHTSLAQETIELAIKALEEADNTTFKEVVAYECGQKSVEKSNGEWIEHYDISDGFTWLTCSRCMFKAYEEDYNFCPNCGADMRGVRE